MDITYTPTIMTFRPTPEQAEAIRRYGIRVTSLDSTHKVLSRVCKCGRVQEIEIETVDTPRNRWEATNAIERLSFEGWTCPLCRLTLAPTPETRGGGGSGSGKAHQGHSRSGQGRTSKKWMRDRIKHLDALILTRPNDPQVEAWKAERETLRTVLKTYKSRSRKTA